MPAGNGRRPLRHGLQLWVGERTGWAAPGFAPRLVASPATRAIRRVPMKLRHIEVINAVLQTGSLSAAARLLNISQPSATKHLQRAELTVGYPLFRRHAGRLHPTQE